MKLVDELEDIVRNLNPYIIRKIYIHPEIWRDLYDEKHPLLDHDFLQCSYASIDVVQDESLRKNSVEADIYFRSNGETHRCCFIYIMDELQPVKVE